MQRNQQTASQQAALVITALAKITICANGLHLLQALIKTAWNALSSCITTRQTSKTRQWQLKMVMALRLIG